jgi:protein-disulfide isomerase
MLKRDKIILTVVAAQCLGLGVFAATMSHRHPNLSQPRVMPINPAQVIDEKRPMIGEVTAPYTLVEFGDYQCPPCAAAQPHVTALLAEHPMTLRFQFRNLPLQQLHPLAERAALTAETAEQHDDFWRVHDVLYAQQKDLTAQFLKKLSQSEPGDLSKARDNIDKDMKVAAQIGIDATPTFLLCTPDKKVLLLNSVLDAQQRVP